VPSSGSGFNLIWFGPSCGLVLGGHHRAGYPLAGKLRSGGELAVRAGDAYKEGGHFDSAVREGNVRARSSTRMALLASHPEPRDNLTEALYILRETAPRRGVAPRC